MKRDLLFALVAILLITAVAYGLGTMRPALPPTPSTPFSLTTGVAAAPGVPAAPGLLPNDKVVMRVNGEPVTEREFDMYLRQAPEQAQPYYAGPNGRMALASQIAKLKALEQEGHRLGADKDADVASRIRFGTANVVAQYAAEKLAGTPNEAALRAEYEKEKGALTGLSHILISYAGSAIPARDGAQRTQKDAEKKARDVQQLLRSGRSFADVAKEFSDDTRSAEAGGFLGPVQPGQLPPEMDAVVSKLKPGEISEPVVTQYGVHIFQIGTAPFAQARPMLEQKVRQDELAQRVAEVEKGAKVELDPKFFPQRTLPPPAVPKKPNS